MLSPAKLTLHLGVNKLYNWQAFLAPLADSFLVTIRQFSGIKYASAGHQQPLRVNSHSKREKPNAANCCYELIHRDRGRRCSGDAACFHSAVEQRSRAGLGC